MSDKERSILEQYAPKAPRLEVIDGRKAATGKQLYKAYGIDKPNNKTVRIRIEHNDQDRTTSSLAKAYLVEVTASADKYISLIFTTAAFMIEGKNLSDLLEKLDDDQVKSICCYSPLWHNAPAENEPLITRIRRMALQDVMVLQEDIVT